MCERSWGEVHSHVCDEMGRSAVSCLSGDGDEGAEVGITKPISFTIK